jgi:hypothetical protein
MLNLLGGKDYVFLRLATAGLAACAAMLFSGAVAAAAAPDSAPLPEGVVLDAATSFYSVRRVPTRSMDEVIKSFETWRHQTLADESTADYMAEDGILSMECSACGMSRPSAIDLAAADLNTLVAYEAGSWHIGVRSTDSTQDFFGVLRGELGSGPHDPAVVTRNRNVALTALVDVHDLAYLTQKPQVAKAPAAAGPPAARPGASKAAAISLAVLAGNGDVEGIQAQQRAKPGSREVAAALETAYGARARTLMLNGEVDASLQTLTDGRKKFGKSATLRDREAHYVVIGDVYDRLRLGVKLDVGALQRYLEEVRTLEPADAAGVEQMLALTLAHRIADQQAAGRDTIAEDLLNAGRQLFPASANLLTRGRSGQLGDR